MAQPHPAGQGRTTVTLAGELDITAVDQLRAILTDVITSHPVVDVDFAT